MRVKENKFPYKETLLKRTSTLPKRTLIATLIVLVVMISSCSWLGNPHKDGIKIFLPDTIEVETPTTTEDVRG